MEIAPWLQSVVTILCAVLASSGFWAFLKKRAERKAAESKQTTVETQMLIGLAYDGNGSVGIDTNEKAKIIPANIRQGVTILGVEGKMSGSEGVAAQSKTVTPTCSSQNIAPDDGYTHLSSVTVNPITVTYTDNSAGGKTVTIGAV